MKIAACIRLTKKAYEWLRRQAYEQNTSQAEVIEELIKREMNRNE